MILTSLWDQTSAERDNTMAYVSLHLMRISRCEWMRPHHSLALSRRDSDEDKVASHLHVKNPRDTKTIQDYRGCM